MSKKSALRERLEAAVLERHCAHHPMTDKWVEGKLGTAAMAGWAIEHYHWISNILGALLQIAAKAPLAVQRELLEGYLEETDPSHPHLDVVLKFAKANGADPAEVKRGRGLPTTEAWAAWLNRVAREESYIAAIAAINIGTESQSPLLYGRVLPALRESYRFKEEDIEHFWLHVDADTEHGDHAFDFLDRHATTPELQDMAVHWARESARMRWFYFDGIYLHYEQGYKLR